MVDDQALPQGAFGLLVPAALHDVGPEHRAPDDREEDMHPLGVDYLTMFGTHPLRYAELAAKAGAQTIALWSANMEPLPNGASRYSLLDDLALCRDLRRTLDDNGLRLGMVDGLVVWPGRRVRDYERGFSQLAELGVTLANTVSFDAMARSRDEFAELVEMAEPYGMTITLESCPALTVRTLAEARAIVREVCRPNFKLLIDTMHVTRSGEADMVPTLDPSEIGYVQISDVPLVGPHSDAGYMEEAMCGRLIPGEGEAPLAMMLGNIPDDVIVSVEVPMRNRQEAGWSHLRCAQAALEGARRVLQSISGAAFACDPSPNPSSS